MHIRLARTMHLDIYLSIIAVACQIIRPTENDLNTVFKFLLRCGKKAGRFWKPLFNHLIQVHVGLKIFFKFGRQMFEKN